LDAAAVTENRNEDRELFPIHVIAGWEGIEDCQGNEVPFNRDNVKEFVEALPDWIFDQIRLHASMPERFLAEDEELSPDPVELAKNSESVSSGS
jgi:hypothetical protein